MKLADGSVTSTKIADGSVSAAKLGAGAVGGKSLTITKRSATVPVAKDNEGVALASCLPGETLIGGGAGWSFTGPEQLVFLMESGELPSKPGTWRAIGLNEALVTVPLNAYAYCLAP